MILTGSKRYFSWKKAYANHFCKVSSDLKPFWQVTIFHTRLPHKPNHGLGLRQGWNSENLKKCVWMAQKRYFSWKKAYAIIFEKFSSDFKPFWQVTIFHTRLPHKPNLGLGLRPRLKFWKLTKMSLTGLKRFFFMKKGIRDHFCKVSSDFKPFWQVTIFHTRLPHKPNLGLGLRKGWNSENLQKWVWLA